MKMPHKFRDMGRLQKVFLVVAAFFALYSIIGFLIFPYFVKFISCKTLTERLHRKVTIDHVGANPYVFSLGMKGFKIEQLHSTDRFVAFDTLYVNLQAVSIIKWAPVVKQLQLDGPYIKVVRTGENRYNFSDLIKNTQKKTQTEKKSSLQRFSVNNIRISSGEVIFEDVPKNTTQRITDIRLDIPRISDFPVNMNVWVKPAFSANVNQSPVSMQGEAKPFSAVPNASFDINLTDLDIPFYHPYFPADLKFNISRGTLSLKMTVEYDQGQKGGVPDLKITGGAQLNNFQAVEKKDNQPLILVPSLSISDILFDLVKKELTIPKLATDNGKIFVKRNQKGEVNLGDLISSPAAKPSGSPVSSSSGKKTSSWHMMLEQCQFKDYTVSVSDLNPPQPFNLTLNKISLQVKNLSNAKNKEASMSLSGIWGENGHFSADGPIGVNPVYADLKLDFSKIDLAPMESYLPSQDNVRLKSATFAASGELLAGYDTEGKPTIHYLGDASLDDFVSSEKKGKQELVRWKTFQLKNIDAQNTPERFSIREVKLEAPYALVTIGKKGKINLMEVLQPGNAHENPKSIQPRSTKVIAAPKASSTLETPIKGPTGGKELSKGSSGQTASMKIDKVILEGGQIDFSDARIQPVFKAGFKDLGGTILGLSAEPGMEAEVNLQGKVYGQSLLEIKGKVSPLSKNLYAKLDIDLEDMGLTPLNPYAKKFIGYGIEKGKLFLRLKYLIAKQKLDSENGIIIDQLTFGNEVQSPEAIDVPIKFVFALLEDRAGQVKLNVPVSGNLDDPKFSLGGIILEALKNLIIKAATSPFAILGDIFGGGEELKYVEFNYGSSDLTQKSTGKLATLVKALYDRPHLELDLAGYVDVQKDGQALQEQQFMKILKAEKLKDLVKEGKGNVSLDQVRIGTDEYGKYLKMAYDEMLSREKTLSKESQPPSEADMNQALLNTIKITDPDLRLLAQQRSEHVERHILDSGKVKPERIYLVHPNTLSPPSDGSLKASRVVLTLK